MYVQGNGSRGFLGTRLCALVVSCRVVCPGGEAASPPGWKRKEPHERKGKNTKWEGDVGVSQHLAIIISEGYIETTSHAQQQQEAQIMNKPNSTTNLQTAHLLFTSPQGGRLGVEKELQKEPWMGGGAVGHKDVAITSSSASTLKLGTQAITAASSRRTCSPFQPSITGEASQTGAGELSTQKGKLHSRVLLIRTVSLDPSIAHEY